MQWRSLPYEAWKETYATLHRLLQVLDAECAQRHWSALLQSDLALMLGRSGREALAFRRPD